MLFSTQTFADILPIDAILQRINHGKSNFFLDGPRPVSRDELSNNSFLIFSNRGILRFMQSNAYFIDFFVWIYWLHFILITKRIYVACYL